MLDCNVFFISQDREATHLECGGVFNEYFLLNFFCGVRL